MNNILELKGVFQHKPNQSRGGSISLKKGQVVKAEHILTLANDLKKIADYWSVHSEIEGALVSAHYVRIVPKSSRLQFLLSCTRESPNDFIVGAKFETNIGSDNKKHHVFTYFIPLEALFRTINSLKEAYDVLIKQYQGKISYEEFEELKRKKIKCNGLSKTEFRQIIVDSSNLQYFRIDKLEKDIHEACIITIYKTKVKTQELLGKFGISIPESRILNQLTIQMNPEEIHMLLDKAPYLVAMGVNDLTQYIPEHLTESSEIPKLIPSPKNEPVIGVIDTPFNKDVYFHEWVDYTNCLSENIPIGPMDYEHGTAVSSIIVDGPRGNPNLDDGCGRFRVRHFGVAVAGTFSSFSIIKQIGNIVRLNRDIKVWNLSLGSVLEINDNFISPEAAELDRLQNEYDIVFIVAGTNLSSKHEKKYKIGAPADSLNSIVVNSVNFQNQSASYSRSGPVLSFFVKPDISYYGGDRQKHEYITVCNNALGAKQAAGTSFAAPWIARKMAYLIYIMGFTREVAKALLIDSATGWYCRPDIKKGYGIVPVSIQDILQSPDDEIKFIIYGKTKNYCTYTYQLPVPVVENKHPYLAKATLVYFPLCNRNQGVDYTDTELDLHFGRLKIDKAQHLQIKSINRNLQAESGQHSIYEEDARNDYRKWDNVKIVADPIYNNMKPRKAYEKGLWGIKLYCKERLNKHARQEVPFGLIITLKEIKGINRIELFKQLCQVRGWIVNDVSVENRVQVYLKGEETIRLD